MNDSQPVPGGQPMQPKANPPIYPKQQSVNPFVQTKPFSSQNNQGQTQVVDVSQYQHPSYQNRTPQPVTETPELVSSGTGEIVLSKEKRKSHLGAIITVIVLLLALIAGICMALYFSNNNKAEQSHALSLDEYRELADSLTENEANLLSVSNLIDKGLSGEINSYMFLISSYADGNNEITNSIDETKAAIPKMSEHLNTLIKSNVDDDIKRAANTILNNYDSYSFSIDSTVQKIQDFKTAFLDSNQNELNSIMTLYDFSSSTTDTINNYERYYQELRSKAEECINNNLLFFIIPIASDNVHNNLLQVLK